MMQQTRAKRQANREMEQRTKDWRRTLVGYFGFHYAGRRRGPRGSGVRVHGWRISIRGAREGEGEARGTRWGVTSVAERNGVGKKGKCPDEDVGERERGGESSGEEEDEEIDDEDDDDDIEQVGLLYYCILCFL